MGTIDKVEQKAILMKKFEKIVDKYLNTFPCGDKYIGDILENVIPECIELAIEKGKAYGHSFCKYGNYGIFMNLARKTDRIENYARVAMNTHVDIMDVNNTTHDEGVIDTIQDLANYSMLWLSYINQERSKQVIGVSK